MYSTLMVHFPVVGLRETLVYYTNVSVCYFVCHGKKAPVGSYADPFQASFGVFLLYTLLDLSCIYCVMRPVAFGIDFRLLKAKGIFCAVFVLGSFRFPLFSPTGSF
jgi:hypothetical protein